MEQSAAIEFISREILFNSRRMKSLNSFGSFPLRQPTPRTIHLGTRRKTDLSSSFLNGETITLSMDFPASEVLAKSSSFGMAPSIFRQSKISSGSKTLHFFSFKSLTENSFARSMSEIFIEFSFANESTENKLLTSVAVVITGWAPVSSESFRAKSLAPPK